jgi:uncharacterized membrane protein HdeD (DUF308 family)
VTALRPSLLVLLLGVLLIVGGVLALANPFAASLAVTTLVGAFLLVGGALQLWMAFSDATDPHRLWNGLVGALGILTGIVLLADPLSGVVSLTLVLGVMFLVTGAMRLIVAFRVRETPFFWMLLLSGAASVLIGVLVFSDFGSAATSLLGILLGIQLLAEGAALVALGLLARNL